MNREITLRVVLLGLILGKCPISAERERRKYCHDDEKKPCAHRLDRPDHVLRVAVGRVDREHVDLAVDQEGLAVAQGDVVHVPGSCFIDNRHTHGLSQLNVVHEQTLEPTLKTYSPGRYREDEYDDK